MATPACASALVRPAASAASCIEPRGLLARPADLLSPAASPKGGCECLDVGITAPCDRPARAAATASNACRSAAYARRGASAPHSKAWTTYQSRPVAAVASAASLTSAASRVWPRVDRVRPRRAPPDTLYQCSTHRLPVQYEQEARRGGRGAGRGRVREHGARRRRGEERGAGGDSSSRSRSRSRSRWGEPSRLDSTKSRPIAAASGPRETTARTSASAATARRT